MYKRTRSIWKEVHIYSYNVISKIEAVFDFYCIKSSDYFGSFVDIRGKFRKYRFVMSIALMMGVLLTTNAHGKSTVELTPNVLGRHDVTHVAISPDGKFAVSGFLKGESIALRIWSRSDARLIRSATLQLTGSRALVLAFSADSSSVKISVLQDEKRSIIGDISVFPGDIPNNTSSNIKLSGDSLELYPKYQRSYEDLKSSQKNTISKLCLSDKSRDGGSIYVDRSIISDDQKILAAAVTGGTVILCDMKTGKKKASFFWTDFPSMENVSPILMISPDSRYLFGSTLMGNSFIFDVEKNKKTASFAEEDPTTTQFGRISSATFTPDAKAILVGRGRGGVEELNMSTGAVVRKYGSEPFAADRISIPGNLCILSRRSSVRTMDCNASAVNTLRLSDRLDLQRPGNRRNPITIDPDASKLYFIEDGYLSAVDLGSGALGPRIPFSAEAEDLTMYFDTNGENPIVVHNIRNDSSVESEIYILDINRGKKDIIFSSDKDTLFSVHSVARSRSGLLLAMATQGSADVLQTGTSKIVARASFEDAGGEADFGTAVIFTLDEKNLISSGADGELRMSRLADSKIVREFVGHNAPVNALALSPDGQLLVSGSEDGTAKIWRISDGKLLRTLDGHSGEITALNVSSDGRTVFSAGADGTFRQWDFQTGELVVTRYLLSNGDWITMTPEGFFDASAEGARLITLVAGRSILSIDQVYDQLYRPDLVREKLAGDPKGLVREAAARIDLDKAIASGAPPRVAFVEPPTTVSGDRADVTVELADQGGGIGKVEWRVNGVTVGLGTRGVGRTDKPAPTSGGQRLSQDIPLSPGDNVVEVVAYNSAGLIASVPVSVKIKSNAPLQPTSSTLYVLAVGVNDYYDSRLALNFAVPDAQAVSEGFSKAKGSYYGQVETRLLLDKEVTPAGLEKAFAEIGAKAKPQDTFVLFMAGHGKTVDGRYYYLPRDFRYRDPSSFATDGIGQDRLQQWIAQIGAQRSVLLFDTCESGSLTGDEFAMRGVERAVAMEKMTAAMGRTTIAAASDTRPALEGYQGHGVFTYAFLEGLNDADGDGNGGVDVLEMMGYLDRQVPELSDRAFKQRQIPQAKFSGNNFVLAAKTTVLDTAGSRAGGAKVDVSTAPGFVVISRADVMTAPANGTRVQVLEPGAQVRVVRTEAGWMVVVRDGREIGYVRAEALARLQ